jgi:hypothetical protein
MLYPEKLCRKLSVNYLFCRNVTPYASSNKVLRRHVVILILANILHNLYYWMADAATELGVSI